MNPWTEFWDDFNDHQVERSQEATRQTWEKTPVGRKAILVAESPCRTKRHSEFRLLLLRLRMRLGVCLWNESDVVIPDDREKTVECRMAVIESGKRYEIRKARFAWGQSRNFSDVADYRYHGSPVSEVEI